MLYFIFGVALPLRVVLSEGAPMSISKRYMLRFALSLFGISLLFFLPLAPSMSQSKLLTNQAYIDDLNHNKHLDINSIKDVFSFVFKELPRAVNVYPTENYFYYTFYHDGVPIEGNIRLDALDRDKGIAHFAYFTRYNRWSDELVSKYKQLSAKDGLQIKKLAHLRYKLTFGNKSVIFNLNDLSNVKPPKNKLRTNEKYLGPVYDESGIQFYLVYNPKIKIFHYILNDSEKTPDILTPSKNNEHIFIGERTGFAFYKDDYLDRLILIGIYEGNSMVNNYFDGPFDQLPDNFIKGNSLQKAFIDQSPELKGKIDRYGNSNGGKTRAMIAPYIHYAYEYQLNAFTDCMKNAADDKGRYYSCFRQEEPNRDY